MTVATISRVSASHGQRVKALNARNDSEASEVSFRRLLGQKGEAL